MSGKERDSNFSGSRGSGKIVSPEALTPAQREIATRLVSNSGVRGVLAGVLLGPSLWDVRPLLLERGELSILRRSDPNLNSSDPRYGYLLSTFERLSGARDIPPQITAWGELSDGLWVLRRYTQTTLVDSPRTNLTLEQVSALVTLVMSLHKARIFHGHISLGNVAFISGAPILLDFGFASSESTPSDELTLAPEIKAGARVSAESDVFGVGLILRARAAKILSDEIRDLVDEMHSSDLAMRPPIHALAEALLPEGERARFSQVTGLLLGSARTGKLLGGKRDSSAEPVNPDITGMSPPKGSSLGIAPKGGVESKYRLDLSKIGTNIIERFKAINKGRGVLVPVALILLVGVGIVSYRYLSTDDSNALLYKEYWASGQPSLISQVINDAVVLGNSSAEDAIVDGVAQGVVPPGVREKILRLGFSSEWRDGLSTADRKILLSVALLPLLSPEEQAKIRIDNSLPPTVIFPIIADLPTGALSHEFEEVSTESLATLPAPYGSSFGKLVEIGATSINDPRVRTLAQLLAGKASDDTIRVFFSDPQSTKLDLNLIISAKVVALSPILKKDKALGKSVFMFLKGTQPGSILGWFEKDPLGVWSSTSPGERVVLAWGGSLDRALGPDQNGDLLRFPNPAVRALAAKALGELRPKSLAQLVGFLSQDDTRITREQSVVLTMALSLEGEPADASISRWFGMGPIPQTVIGVLIQGGGSVALESFNVEAARYLKDKEFSATTAQLRALAFHPEPLVRTIAYSKLDASKPEEAAVLQEAAAAEQKINLKNTILEKLSSAMEPK